MAYRDDHRCHLCGDETKSTCSVCGNGVCEPHTLAGLAAQLSGGERRQIEALAKRFDGEACEQCLEQELERRSGPYVAIYRDSDPIQVQMLAEALGEEGFDVRVLGSQNASLLGAGQHIFEQRIEVPEPQAEEAATQISALLGAGFELPDGEDPDQGHDGAEGEGDGGGAGGLDAVGTSSEDPAEGVEPDEEEDDDEDDEEDADPRGLSPRRRSLAFGAALIFPGASHFYLGRPFFALWLTAAFFVGGWRAMESMSSEALLPPLVGAMLVDLVGGQLVLSAINRGVRRPAWLQMLEGAIVALLLVGAGTLVAMR